MRYFFVIFKNCDKVKKLQSRLFIFMIFFLQFAHLRPNAKPEFTGLYAFAPPDTKVTPT